VAASERAAVNGTDTTVLVFFGVGGAGGDVFTLDDATRGVLDSATYTLGGDTGSDVTSDVRHVSIQRGRTSPIFDNVNAGTASIELNNEDRAYDPEYTAGEFYGNIMPTKRVSVVTNGVTVFDGQIADWSLDYQVSGKSTATIDAEDALAVLSRQQFTEWTATSAQTAGDRYTDILNRSEVAWSGGARDLDTGISTLQGDAVSWGSNVLSYCQLVAQSDLGTLFVSRDGVLTFHDRHHNYTASTALAFADDGTGIAFHEIGRLFGSENFYNRVSVDREGGTVQTVVISSATDDGIRSLSLDGLLMDSDDQSLSMAEYIANTFATGESRISSLRVRLNELQHTVAEIQSVLSLDVNSLVSVTWTPNGVGDPIEQTCVVEGMRHDIGVEYHDVTLYLGKFVDTVFILDDATLGVLDGTNNLLSF
jgi:hypothetical protein